MARPKKYIISLSETDVHKLQTIYNCMEFCGVSSTAFSNVLAGIIIQSPFFAPVPC